jgi:hypothetical protein
VAQRVELPNSWHAHRKGRPAPTPPCCHLEFIIIQEPRPAVNSTKESKKGGRDSEEQASNGVSLEARLAAEARQSSMPGAWSKGGTRRLPSAGTCGGRRRSAPRWSPERRRPTFIAPAATLAEASTSRAVSAENRCASWSRPMPPAWGSMATPSALLPRRSAARPCHTTAPDPLPGVERLADDQNPNLTPWAAAQCACTTSSCNAAWIEPLRLAMNASHCGCALLGCDRGWRQPTSPGRRCPQECA